MASLDGPSLAVLVRTWRERALLTQEQLARKTGLGVRTIRRLESGGQPIPRIQSVRLLADGLGLTEVERALLIATVRDEREQPRPAAATLVPRQLPADVIGFAGRTGQLRRLDALLGGGDGTPTAVVISAIAGTAGVGKTALAVHWAHRVADRFPDGQLYVNLRGFGPTTEATDPATALRGFLDALDVPAPRMPRDQDARAALYRSIVADRRMLVVLDNARDAEQVRPLLPGAPGCRTLITSRNLLTGLVATGHADALLVDLLSVPESRDLLRRRLGARVVEADAPTVDEIISRCARLPLALAIVAAHAATHPIPIPVLAAELRDARSRLDAFTTGDAASDLRAVFSWSYDRLSAGAARLFRLLGLHPGPDLTAAAAGSLAGVSTGQAGELLDELTRAHLLTEHTPGRFACHDLLRAFAVELVDVADHDAERRRALTRMLDHYLHTAHAAATLLHPLRRRFSLDEPQRGVTTDAFDDEEQALGWLTAEHAVLIAAVQLAVGAGCDRHAYQIAWCLTDYLDWRGHWRDWATTQGVALRAAERLGDTVAQVLAHRGLAGASARQGDYDRAHTHLTRALELLDGQDEPAAQAQVHLNLSTVAGRRKQRGAAVDHGLRALALYRAANDRVGEGDALGGVGWQYSLLGEYRLAVEYCQQALDVQRELGNREGEAAALDSIGHAYHHLGQYSQAIESYRRAIELCRILKNRYYEAFSLHHLGDVCAAAGDPDAARRHWTQAVDILDELGHAEADEIRAKIHQRNG